MTITHVEIRNFRCFKYLDLDLTQTHALIGENGCGKTTVLEAINMVMSGGMPHLKEQDFNNADEGDLSVEVFFDELFLSRIPDGYATQDIPCRSVKMLAHRREKASQGKALSDPFVVERYSVPFLYDGDVLSKIKIGDIKVNVPLSVQKTDSGYQSPRKTGNMFKFLNTSLGFQNETINLPNVFYFDRNREDQSKVGFNSLLQKVARDLNWRYRKEWDKEKVHNTWEEFYYTVVDTVDNQKTSKIIQPIRDSLKRVTGLDFSDLELGLLDIEEPFSKSFFSRRNKTNQIDQKSFGSGISILLAYFLLEIVSKFSKENIIFLIDEPELHLHPQLQYQLFDEFIKSEFQIVYTTQSDCFINISEWQSISRFNSDFAVHPIKSELDIEKDGQKLSDHLNEIKQWHQHQSIFFREDNQIFFSKRCMLVEGPAEKYGIPVLAKKLEKDINGITIISCNGKSKIRYYQLLCKSFAIPFYTIFDLDGEPLESPSNNEIYNWSDNSAISTFISSFEIVLGINPNSNHKASETLTRIDDIEKNQIPEDIKNIISSIETWNMSLNSHV